MKLKQVHKLMMHVDAESIEEYHERLIHLPYTRPSEVMVGRVLKAPQTNPYGEPGETPAGSLVLFRVISPDMEPLAEPIGGQRLMEEGEYVIFTSSLLAVLEVEEPEEERYGFEM